ncbi:ribonuclease HII [Lacinutrix sp. Bg11-31]|uniref:ribonuclease HII n=1 Tax=Lacinutrix sp. Bg11-31 TaxID=2057808 RepID=UPI000C304689|nr:ribonuclease HII [Lacinutrix sp. Bg11-31]AUC83610.1 ribonuclease HII [Lacinutrix sp. Bg11-31]
MKRIYLILILLTLLFSCNSNSFKKASIYDFVPDDASIIVTINDTESLETNINNNAFINGIMPSSAYKSISKKLNYLEHINTENPVVLSFLKDKNDSLQFTISTKQVDNLFSVDSLPNYKIESLQIANKPAQKITLNNEILYTTFKDSIAIAASNKTLLETVLTKKSKNEERQKIINTINNDNTVSIILGNTNDNLIQSFFNSEALPFKDFSDYTSIDAVISQDEILFNGITKALDSSKKLINIFKNTVPQENELAKITPNNSDGFLSFTFNDFKSFKSNLDTFNKKEDSTTTTNLFDNIIEIGTIYTGENQAIVLNSIDVISTKDNLVSEHNEVENFRQVPIYDFSKPELFETTFYPLINYSEAKYYCTIDQFFIFAKNTETLENIIANYLNKTTLSSRDYYKNITKDLSNESSILQILSNDKLKDLLDLNLDTHLESTFKDYKISALQFVYDTHYAHLHGAIKKNKVKIEPNAVTELLNISLDADLLNNPQFVTNHRTKQKEIIVQDINNKLYLISNIGNILWKKQLNGPVLGKIEQLDIYKNGRLQFVFATPNRVYLLDRTGRDVTGYPLKFNDKITQPLSVFDYDKRKNYRLFVTQGKNVLLYDAKGKTVKGFKFSSAKNTINHQPQHIRIGNKDYILIKTDKKLNILNRRGQTRIKLDSNLELSNEPVFSYNSTFTTTTADGKIISIDQKGKVNTKPYNLTENHHLAATTKTLASQNENILNIKSETLELDLGNYSPVKIFYIKDKIYISVTDLQSQKVLLFDSQAKLIENFPVYGNSSIELDNIDRDKSLEFVTKGNSNSILLYEIN